MGERQGMKVSCGASGKESKRKGGKWWEGRNLVAADDYLSKLWMFARGSTWCR